MNSRYEEHKRDEEFEAQEERRRDAMKISDDIKQMVAYWEAQRNKHACPMCGSTRLRFADEEITDASTGYFEIVTMYMCQACFSRGRWDGE